LNRARQGQTGPNRAKQGQTGPNRAKSKFIICVNDGAHDIFDGFDRAKIGLEMELLKMLPS
jgi:hypothetical protein